jgi:hypothetical protein
VRPRCVDKPRRLRYALLHCLPSAPPCLRPLDRPSCSPLPPYPSRCAHPTCVCRNLFNKAELAMQLVGCPPQLNEAQLLLHLYAAKGLDMLGMLQGQYAFCLYDSKQVSITFSCTPELCVNMAVCWAMWAFRGGVGGCSTVSEIPCSIHAYGTGETGSHSLMLLAHLCCAFKRHTSLNASSPCIAAFVCLYQCVTP